MRKVGVRACLWAAISIALFSVNAVAQDRKPIKVDKARVIQHWTKERRANAIPRDLVIDSRGLGYLKRPDGTLQPHGHDTPAEVTPTNHSISPFASRSNNRVGGGGKSRDKTPPSISNMDPAEGTIIGESHTFEARVTDTSGVQSVTFKIQRIGSTYVNSFSASRALFSNTWGANFHGFTDGDWKWWIEATDGAGNVGSSGTVNFAVYTGTASEPVGNAVWSSGGTVQTAAGRLYFEMPDEAIPTNKWRGYVCSATVATDDDALEGHNHDGSFSDHGRSLIITAAHCVYDDAHGAFARNVMFIPNQAGSGTKTDLDCSNDVLGCWVPSFGVVDANWASGTFPANMGWDYAFYVFNDSGAHLGTTASSDALDVAAKSLPLSFVAPNHDVANSNIDFTHAFGYSYSEDPNFMYCAEDLSVELNSGYNTDWWLGNCGLTGGSSGGAWVQPMDKSTGSGPIISVNSWGYVWNGQELPGMAGPKLYEGVSTASCVFDKAKTATVSGSPEDGHAGVAVSCP